MGGRWNVQPLPVPILVADPNSALARFVEPGGELTRYRDGKGTSGECVTLWCAHLKLEVLGAGIGCGDAVAGN